MIDVVSHRDGAQISWQDGFLEMLPEIEQRLRRSFRYHKPESLDDAIEDGIVHCLLAYKRLSEKGRVQSASPSSLVWYATLQFRSGRRAGCRMNSR